MSDLSDNEDLTDDDTAFYPRTSEELARIGRHKHSSLSSPTLASPSLIPSLNVDDEDVYNHNDVRDYGDRHRDRNHSGKHRHGDSHRERGRDYVDTDDLLLQPKKQRTSSRSSSHSLNFGDDLELEDIGVGTEDLNQGPIVQPSAKDLKLLEDLVPADDDDPRFVQAPDSVTIVEGDTVKFSCKVAGTQPIG
jgi:hypothetical protein